MKISKNDQSIPSTPVRSSSSESSADSKVAKAYQVTKSPTSGRIRFPVSPASLKKRGIYRITNVKTGASYIGKADHVGRRNTKRTSEIHKVSSQGDLSKYHVSGPNLYKDLLDHTEEFTFSILREVGPDEDIEALEVEFIRQYKTCENGYNRNSGGGGGRSLDPKLMASFKAPASALITPTKLYPINDSSVEFTPGASEKKYVVYLVIDTVTQKRYVGCTVQKLSKRFQEHLSASRNPNNGAYHRELMQALREGGDAQGRFQVGILAEADSFEEVRFKEAYFIKIEGEKHPLFNGNLGSTAVRTLFSNPTDDQSS